MTIFVKFLEHSINSVFDSIYKPSLLNLLFIAFATAAESDVALTRNQCCLHVHLCFVFNFLQQQFFFQLGLFVFWNKFQDVYCSKRS